MSGCQRFLVNVSVWENGGLWLARSEQMPMKVSSNSLEGIHGLILAEFRKHYTEKTGKLRIETDFV